MVMFRPPVVYNCSCAVILVSSVVLRMSLLFLEFETEGSQLPISRKEPGRTHTHTSYGSCDVSYWSRSWGVAQLLVLRGVPPRFHSSEEVG